MSRYISADVVHGRTKRSLTRLGHPIVISIWLDPGGGRDGWFQVNPDGHTVNKTLRDSLLWQIFRDMGDVQNVPGLQSV